MSDPMRLVRDERADVADLLAGLGPEQWDPPTLAAALPIARVRRRRS